MTFASDQQTGPPGDSHPGGSFPAAGGLYVLFCTLRAPEEITIGQLGRFDFPAGLYAYIGSARGPGGLGARLNRHISASTEKRKHWHIDYFLARAVPQAAGWCFNCEINECEWSQALAALGRRWPHRFGASDCRCPGHLIRFQDQITIQDISTSIPSRLQVVQLQPKGQHSSF